MAACIKQIYNIDPSIDISNETDDSMNWTWCYALPTELNRNRVLMRKQMVADGKTEELAFKSLLDKDNRKLLRTRQFVNVEYASEFALWYDENIGVTIPQVGPVQYTLSVQEILDNTTLDQVTW